MCVWTRHNGSTGTDIENNESSLASREGRCPDVKPFRVKVMDDNSVKGVKTDTKGDGVRSRPWSWRPDSDFTDVLVQRPSDFLLTEIYVSLIFTLGLEPGVRPF